MDKTEQTSDWEADVLAAAQVEYAALDATVAVDLYEFFAGHYSDGEELFYVDQKWRGWDGRRGWASVSSIFITSFFIINIFICVLVFII